MDYYGPEYYEEIAKYDAEHKQEKVSKEEYIMLTNERV